MGRCSDWLSRRAESIFWFILPYLIAFVAFAVGRKVSESEDPKATALQLGRQFTNLTRSNLRNE